MTDSQQPDVSCHLSPIMIRALYLLAYQKALQIDSSKISNVVAHLRSQQQENCCCTFPQLVKSLLKVKPGKCSNIWCCACLDLKISKYNKAPCFRWRRKTSQESDLRWAYSQAVSEFGTSTSIATGESCKELVKEMAVGRRVDGDDPVIVDDAEPVASICWLGTASFSTWISETSNSSASSSSTELSWLTELS